MFCCASEPEATEVTQVNVVQDLAEVKEVKEVKEESPKEVQEESSKEVKDETPVAEVTAQSAQNTVVDITQGTNMQGEETTQEKKIKTRKPAPFCKMFMFATPGDLVILSIGVLAAVLAGGAFPVLIVIMGKLMDAIGAVNMSELIMQALLVAAGVFVMSAVQVICFRFFAERQAIKMISKYYESMLYKDMSWFDQQSVASLPAELLDGTTKVAEAVGDKLGTAISALAGCIWTIGVAFSIAPKLAGLSCAFIPMIGIGGAILGVAMEGIANDSQEWYAQAAETVEEVLFAVRTLVAFGGERREIRKYEAAVVKARAGGVKQAYITAFGMGWIELWWAAGSATALYYGMTLVVDGEKNNLTGEVYTAGDILTVFFCVLVAGFLLSMIDPANKAMTAGRGALARFLEVTEAPAVIQCRTQDVRKHVTSFKSFEFKDVYFSYPTRPEVSVLNGLNLMISEGQKVALVGESGCGKSTVMSLLERFYDPSQGCVLLNDEDLKQFSPSSVRAMIGYVGQEPVLFATSVEENIMYGLPTASQEDLNEAMKAAQLDFLESLPSRKSSFVGSGGSQFSGGQKQRIAIARALLRKPKILFLDEATSALDSASEILIQETIDEISKTNITVVAIAHRLSTVQDFDTICALKRGVVVESGNHDDLMNARGLYYALAAAQGMSSSMSEARKNRKSAALEEKRASECDNAGAPSSAAPVEIAGPSMELDTENEARRKQIAKTYSVPYRQLLRYNRPEWPLFAPGILGAVLHGAVMPVQAWLLVSVLSSIHSSVDEMEDAVTRICIMFWGLAVLAFFVAAAHYAAFGVLAEAMVQRLRVAILTNVFRQEVGFHDDPEHTPALIGLALQLWAFRIRIFMADLEAKVNMIAMTVIALTIAFIGSWQLTLTSFITGPILGASMAVQFMFMMNGLNMGHDKMKVASQLASDSLQNARTIQATGMERGCIERHASCVAGAVGGLRSHVISGLAFALGNSAPLLYVSFGFWFSDWLVKNGHGDYEGTMLAFMCVLFSANGVGQAAGMVGDMSKAKAACHDMFKVLNRESQIDGLEPNGKKLLDPNGKRLAEVGRIEFQNVQFAYPFRKEVMVLQDVTFKIEPEQFVGLVGPSGGGKSTIMALIQRFYDPAEGSISIGAGNNKTLLSAVDIRWWRRQVGFVGQEPILFNTTLRANILYGLDTDAGETITEQHLLECMRMANLNFLDSASGQGLEMEVGPRGSKLSGGQKQRVAICRALVRDPALLLLDEATSALDTESERVVQQALENARRGRTSIAIAHRLSTVLECDLILVAADGVIVEQGTHAELMEQKGVYFKLKESSGEED
mmetsp:Transcript_134539/g.335689  ORF Transcript_134539/g.335689 Transcript_134539/m.335689 type:complete len:1325 (+) Transcript_134539:96-4070(+)